MNLTHIVDDSVCTLLLVCFSCVLHNTVKQITVGVEVEFNTPQDTILVISEAVFTTNHLRDTDKQNNTGKYTN